MKVFYTAGVWAYTVMVWVASLWHPKAKKWILGRRETRSRLTAFGKTKRNTDLPLYWFHCASLGEFEQGRPLIEALKARESCQIAVSFFSPSGYEIRKNYELADVLFYLPVDSVSNARFVYENLHPRAVFIIKYEFWANYIFEAKSQNVPVYIVAAVFRKNQVFFKWYGGFMRRVLGACTAIFVQNEASQDLLKRIGITAVVSGDTRYDRVMKNATTARKFPAIDAFTRGHRIFVCGSLWTPDLEVVASELMKLGSDWKIILTTHEIDANRLREVEDFFAGKQVVRYSQLSEENFDAGVLLIDNIGMLMHLYGYSDLAYVGGAFKTGLHNILEPASFGLPVIFGPHHQKFPEASLFIENGIGFSISSSSQFEQILKTLQNQQLRDLVIAFMKAQCGATESILKRIGNPR